MVCGGWGISLLLMPTVFAAAGRAARKVLGEKGGEVGRTDREFCRRVGGEVRLPLRGTGDETRYLERRLVQGGQWKPPCKKDDGEDAKGRR